MPTINTEKHTTRKISSCNLVRWNKGAPGVVEKGSTDPGSLDRTPTNRFRTGDATELSVSRRVRFSAETFQNFWRLKSKKCLKRSDSRSGKTKHGRKVLFVFAETVFAKFCNFFWQKMSLFREKYANCRSCTPKTAEGTFSGNFRPCLGKTDDFTDFGTKLTFRYRYIAVSWPSSFYDTTKKVQT